MRVFVASVLSPDDREFDDSVVAALVAREGDVLRAIPRRSAHVRRRCVAWLSMRATYA
jgi:hypothetical protein